MATSCVLCERRSENAQEVSFHVFPENEDRRRKWLDAIGKTDAEVPAGSSLCSRHFSRSCFAGATLRDDVVPTSELGVSTPCSETPTAPPQKMELYKLSPHTSTVVRPIIRRRRIHMLSEEEMRKMQPMKYVRYLKSVDWDEISKIPDEAKIVWEVAMEELKEGYDKIKLLQANVRRLKATMRNLRAALKARTRRAAAAVAAAARRDQSLDSGRE